MTQIATRAIQGAALVGLLVSIAWWSAVFLARLLTACFGAPGPGGNWSVPMTALGSLILILLVSPVAAWACHKLARGRTSKRTVLLLATIAGGAAVPVALVPLLFLLVNPPAPLACAAALLSVGGTPDTLIVIRSGETTIWYPHEEPKPHYATQERALSEACRGSTDSHIFLQVPATWAAPERLLADCKPQLYVIRRRAWTDHEVERLWCVSDVPPNKPLQRTCSSWADMGRDRIADI